VFSFLNNLAVGGTLLLRSREIEGRRPQLPDDVMAKVIFGLSHLSEGVNGVAPGPTDTGMVTRFTGHAGEQGGSGYGCSDGSRTSNESQAAISLISMPQAAQRRRKR
jgi:hypothetical protein